MSQGNSLYSYLKQTKIPIFLLLFFKNEEQEDKTDPFWRLVAMGGGKI
jgi:hypothetical protein